jgi:flagellar motor switch protein FliN/FliY
MEEETVAAAQAAATAGSAVGGRSGPDGGVRRRSRGEAAQDQGQGQAQGPRDIDFLLDIPLVVSVEIGRTRMLIKDLLQLGQGSVIEFEKLVGEPMEVLVNEKLIARGEVVVVNEKFGVRLTDISSPAERLKHLK